MEYKNMTEAMREQGDSLDSCKPQIIAKLKEYIEKDMSKKSKRKHSDFVKKALDATVAQISFGPSPKYAKGYVYGNVTARGYKYSGDTTYTRTISVDLQTPEYTFFNVDHVYNTKEICNAREMYKRACIGLSSWRHSLYSVKKGIFSKKRESKIYLLTLDESKALEDYAIDECEEMLWRLDYKIEDCRVNDYDFVQTQELKVCNFYPVYLNVTNHKGKEDKVLIGYYNADSDYMYCDINFKELSASDIIGGLFACICLVPPVIAAIVFILWLFGIIKV